MPGRPMTAGEVAALAFRILGVVILLIGLAEGLFVALGQFQIFGLVESDFSLWDLAGLLVVFLFLGAVALPLIFHAEGLVRWLFPPSDKTVDLALSRRAVLTIGLLLVGVWILATNIPYLARLASQTLYFAEGTRRELLPEEFFGDMAFEALQTVFACLAGWALARYAGRIAAWLEAKGADSSESAPVGHEPPESS